VRTDVVIQINQHNF